MMRAQTNIQTAVNRPLRERLGSLILAEPPSRRSSGVLLHLDPIDGCAPLEPLTPAPGVLRAPLVVRRRFSHPEFTLPVPERAGCWLSTILNLVPWIRQPWTSYLPVSSACMRSCSSPQSFDMSSQRSNAAHAAR